MHVFLGVMKGLEKPAKSRRWRGGLVLALAAFMTAPTLMATRQTGPQRIEEVLIVGNRRIPEKTIRFYIQTKPNDSYNHEQILRDYRSLLNTSFFEDASVKRRDGETGIIITFEVKERPLIRDLEYKGNKSFKESDILERFRDMRVGMTVDSPFDESKIPRARRAIKMLLDQNGRPLGRVEVSTERITSSTVKVIFEVDEGPKVRIGRIAFEGNTVLADKELRESLELNKEKGFGTLFKQTDKFIKDKLEYDIQVNMLAKYKEIGYIYARAGEPRVEIVEARRGFLPVARKTKQQYYITVPIEEGEQYSVASFRVEGVVALPEDLVKRAYHIEAGELVNYTALRKSNDDLQKFYTQRGYLDMEALPQVQPNHDELTVDILVKVEEGKQYLVNHIEFAGNTRTRDKVLRREFVLEEQQRFDGQLLDISVLRLNQLGFFEKIEEEDYEVIKKPNQSEVDVLIRVKERSTQSIGLTGGISGISGSFFGINYQTNNFRGLGQRIDVNILTGTRSALFNFSMTDPYFLDTKTSVGWSVFRQRSVFDTFTLGLASGIVSDPSASDTIFVRTNTGFSVSASRRFRRWSRIGLRYSLSSINIPPGDIDPNFQGFAESQLLGFTPGGDPSQLDNSLIRSEITPTFTYNTKNSFFSATRGRSLSVQLPIAGGPLGGTYNIIRPTVEFQQFLPDRFLSKGRHTLAFRLSFSHILPFGKLSNGNESIIPFFERIFLGGEQNLRGFDIRSVSPLAVTRTPNVDSLGNPIIDPESGLPSITESAIAIGADTRAVMTAEYRVPIAGPLQVAAFVDYGTAAILNKENLQVFGGDTFIQLLDSTNNIFRMSTGAEIQFLMPVVNQPFRLILAYNPYRLETDILLNGARFRRVEPRTNIKFTVGYNF